MIRESGEAVDRMMAAGALTVASSAHSETVKLVTAAEAQGAMAMAGKVTGA